MSHNVEAFPDRRPTSSTGRGDATRFDCAVEGCLAYTTVTSFWRSVTGISAWRCAEHQ